MTSSRVSFVSIIIMRRTRPSSLNMARIWLLALSESFLICLKSNMIFVDCFEASRKRFLIVFLLVLVGVFISQIVPSIIISGFLVLFEAIGLIISISKPN